MKVRSEELSTPSRPGIGFNVSKDPDRFGRWSENIARFFGTGRYLAIQTVVVIVWILINTVAVVGGWWDPYPFILLNLVFSTQAAYAAPLILLAQNRQETRDRAIAERDRNVNGRILSDTEFLSRELAAIRLALADMITIDDLESALDEAEARIRGSDEPPDRPLPPS